MKARKGYKEKPEFTTGKWLKYYFEKFTCKVSNSKIKQLNEEFVEHNKEVI